MREGDPEFEALRDAIDAYGLTRAGDVVAEARIAAETKVRAMLTDALAQSLLEHAEPELQQSGEAPSPARAPRTSASSPAVAAKQERAAPPEDRSAPRTAAGERPSAGPKTPAPEEETGYYVYGVVSATEVDLPVDIPGVDSAEPAGLISHAGLAA